MNLALQLKGVEKAFTQGETKLNILSGLDLDLSAQEIVAVVGESGSGKSTLLSILAGFNAPDRGELIWNGQNVRQFGELDWALFRRQHLGFVFQSYHLIPYLTALENVALPLRLLAHKDAARSALAMLTSLGLEKRADHLPSQMSGGECQRVAIARALVHQPSLVLADEPTGSLDQQTGAQVLDLLFTQLRERKQSALLVTHSMDVAARCDRVLRMREGRLWSS